jgi:hypothetical protein
MAILPISLPNFCEAFKMRSLLQPFMAKAFDIAWNLLKGTLTPDGKPTMTEGPQLCPCDGKNRDCKQCYGKGYYFPRDDNNYAAA